MEPVKKRETLVQNIAYMAIMAAINVIFVLLTTLVPVLLFLIVFVLPLTSVIVTLHCKKIYFPIYAIATIGLCMLVTIWKIDDTIFYVIPSIISGFIFGLLIEKQFPSFWIIFITTIVQIGFTYASIPLIKVMVGRNIVTDFATIFSLQDFEYLDYVVPCFIFFISLAQEIIAFIIIRNELPKFGYELNDPKHLPLSLFISLASSSILAFIFMFVYGPLGYLFTLFSLFFGIYAIGYLINDRNLFVYIALPSSLILSIFLFAGLYSLADKPNGLIFINIFFFTEAIIVLINNYLLKRRKIDTIK